MSECRVPASFECQTLNITASWCHTHSPIDKTSCHCPLHQMKMHNYSSAHLDLGRTNGKLVPLFDTASTTCSVCVTPRGFHRNSKHWTCLFMSLFCSWRTGKRAVPSTNSTRRTSRVPLSSILGTSSKTLTSHTWGPGDRRPQTCWLILWPPYRLSTP